MKKIRKTLKLIFTTLIITTILVPTFLAPYVNVNAAEDNRTIKSILADIEAQKKEIEENKNKQKLTEAQIKAIRDDISLKDANIKKGQEDIINLNNEIAELQVEIEEKDAEMRKIVVFLEVSNGESEYLEYMFGATTFTDFIYRMAITEQLTDYNDRLIKEYNEMIESNKRKTEEIAAKEVQLKQEQAALQVQISKLSVQISSLSKEQASLEEGIEASEAQIKTLIADGCSEDETVSACYARIRTLPSDTSFWRPTTYGSISSLYGWRSYYIGSTYYQDFHYGLDIAMPTGTPVYAVANGRISYQYYWPGTGYVVYVEHLVNGTRYTSVYEHLSNNHVLSVGTNVTKDTIIAYSGNTGQSSGPHLHLALIYGWFGQDWTSYWGQTYMNSTFDPKTKINFPNGYGSYTTRNRNCSLGAC